MNKLTWLFPPPALGIAPSEYTSSQFYSDLRTYTRLKTPLFNVQSLLSSPDSPLVLLERRIGDNPSVTVQRMLRQEIKLLTTVVRKIQTPNGERVSIEPLQQVLQRWRSVHRDLTEKKMLPKTIACLNIADEVLSNHWEMCLIEDADTSGVSYEREEMLLKELAYRKSIVYLVYSTVKKEHYLFHFGNLVKYVSTVLYLDTNVDVSSRWLRHTALAQAQVWCGRCLFVMSIARWVLIWARMSLHLIGMFAELVFFLIF